MKIIGITGGVGSGKSKIIEYLRNNYDSYVILVDFVVARLQNKGEKNYEEIINLFGRKILNEDNTICKDKLRKICFENTELLKKLQEISSQNVIEEIEDEIEFVKEFDCYDYLFIENAILFESGLSKLCDEIWYIYAEESIRIERIKNYRGYTNQMCETLIKAQLSEKEFREKCDIIINNNDKFDKTKQEIDKHLQGGK